MRKLFLIALGILALFLFLMSCKTRQVQKSTSSLNLQVDSTASKKQASSSVDTSKKNTQVKTVVADSAETEMDIDTDTGVVKAKVDKDGNFSYTGKAKKITVKNRSGHAQVTNTATQEVKGKSTNSTKTDSTGLKKNLKAAAQAKTVTSKFDAFKTVEFVVIFAMIILGIWAFLRWKAAEAKPVVDEINKIL